MPIGEPAAIDVATMLLHTRRNHGRTRVLDPYRRCGSIEIEAGRSLPTKIGRRMCD
jgi:hypothetical protein